MARQALAAAAEHLVEDLRAHGHRRDFEYDGITTAYCSDEDTSGAWIAQFLDGYFLPTRVSIEAEATVYSTADAELFGELQRVVSEPRLGKDDHVAVHLTGDVVLVHTRATKVTPEEDVYRLLLIKQRSVVLVTSGNSEVRREEGMQTLRSLGKWLLLERGWIPMHSACAARHGRAICVSGYKASGKTSTLLNLLEKNGCDLVAIDKFLVRDAGSGLETLGIPGKCGVRVGSAVGHPRLLDWLAEEPAPFFPHPSADLVQHIAASHTAEELRSHREKINLLPAELVQLFRTRVTSTAPLELLLIPVFDLGVKESRLVPAQPEQALEMLMGCYTGLLSKGEDYLLHLVEVSDAVLQERLAAMLSMYLPVVRAYHLVQNHTTNEQTAELLEGVLG
jgi:hypothetical protein